jgi:hypothetical protein
MCFQTLECRDDLGTGGLQRLFMRFSKPFTNQFVIFFVNSEHGDTNDHPQPHGGGAVPQLALCDEGWPDDQG